MSKLKEERTAPQHANEVSKQNLIDHISGSSQLTAEKQLSHNQLDLLYLIHHSSSLTHSSSLICSVSSGTVNVQVLLLCVNVKTHNHHL